MKRERFGALFIFPIANCSSGIKELKNFREQKLQKCSVRTEFNCLLIRGTAKKVWVLVSV